MTSPCTTCATLADCGTCLPRLAYEGATNVDPAPCLTCADAEWLLICGEGIETTAARLRNNRRQPFTAEGLATHLRRHGRGDLVPANRRWSA